MSKPMITKINGHNRIKNRQFKSGRISRFARSQSVPIPMSRIGQNKDRYLIGFFSSIEASLFKITSGYDSRSMNYFYGEMDATVFPWIDLRNQR
jgi:hypothetical protein